MLAEPKDGRAVAAIVKLIGSEIAPAAIDGIAAAELVYDEGERRRSRRSPRSDRPPRNGHGDAARSKLAAEHRPLSSLAGASPLTKNGEGATHAVAATASRPPRPLEHKPREEGRQTVGFGDHLPAFLARPPRIVARP
jgi:hypothetical protein